MIGVPVKKCRVCGNRELVTVCDLGTMALTGVFLKKGEKVPSGPLELVKCHGDKNEVCGLVQLRHAFDPRVLFGKTYGYRSGLNRSMREHLRDLSEKIRRISLLKAGDTVIDIASNDGALLHCFSGEGLSLVGVDPLAEQFKKYYPKDAQRIREFFSGAVVRKELSGRKAKAVTAIAMFYDLAEPLEFLEEVREILCDDGVLMLEQSYLPSVLENLAYDSICHEHAALYRMKQMKWLADRTGFKIIRCEQNQVNGGSFCIVLAKKESPLPEARESIERLLDLERLKGLETLEPYQGFQKRVLGHREALCREIRSLKAAGKRVLGYGASTKGNVLLQFCGFSPDDIPGIADVNESKWGSVCPGTGIPIIAEADARRMDPDIFFVLPWHFKEGFLEKEKKFLQDGGAFLFPLPEPVVIRA